jgi:arylformamidase
MSASDDHNAMSASDDHNAMSASDDLTLTGHSELADPAAALREALGVVAAGLARAGAGPQHLVAMTWSAPNPAAFHPARRVIELAYREVFVGFRPEVTLAHGSARGLSVSASAVLPGPSDPRAIWRTYAAAELARQYSARSQAPDMGAVFARWTTDGAIFRARHDALDLCYGPEPAARLDIYRPAGTGKPPLFVYIHGGYWQAASKEQNAQFAAGLVRAGFAVANLGYDLCPETPLPQIVAQIRRALNFLQREADRLGVDARSLHLVGHSAGAHLAAMMAADPESPPVASALLISGLFDLQPLALLPMGAVLGLTDAATVRNNSPINARPRPGCRVALAVGALESDEFKRQSDEFAAAWHADPPLVIAGCNHFGVLEHLIEGDLLQRALTLAKP